MLDWYGPHIAGVTLPAVTQAEFGRIWNKLFDEILDAPATWTLRDFHSPNLIWLEEREGLAKLGLIDFQDAVLGHPAYDLVSLGQDARVDVPAALELRLLAAYGAARRADAPDFELAQFARAYAILGAQRNTKIAGIFARLDKRDGKPAYLKHLPRIEAYLRRNLEHPALEELKAWYQAHMPKLFEAGEGTSRAKRLSLVPRSRKRRLEGCSRRLPTALERPPRRPFGPPRDEGSNSRVDHPG